MFTGIVKGLGSVRDVTQKPGLTHFGVSLDKSLLTSIETGASIAIDGTCLTVVTFNENTVWFDAIQETLQRTTLGTLRPGKIVNVERSAKFGDEIGGHLLSGHIYDMATIISIQRTDNNCIVTMQAQPTWIKYLFPKGYIALNGVSLTLVDVDTSHNTFSVHLIPETLSRTTFGNAKVGDRINVEIDSQTQTIVDTLSRMKGSDT